MLEYYLYYFLGIYTILRNVAEKKTGIDDLLWIKYLYSCYCYSESIINLKKILINSGGANVISLTWNSLLYSIRTWELDFVNKIVVVA